MNQLSSISGRFTNRFAGCTFTAIETRQGAYNLSKVIILIVELMVCWTRLSGKRTRCISQRFFPFRKTPIGFEPIYSNIVLRPAPLSFLWLYHSRLWLEKSYKKSCAYKKAAKKITVLRRFPYVKQKLLLFLHLFAEKCSSRLN